MGGGGVALPPHTHTHINICPHMHTNTCVHSTFHYDLCLSALSRCTKIRGLCPRAAKVAKVGRAASIRVAAVGVVG